MTTEHAASAPETAGALTLARSRHALYLFLASAGGTLALFMFIRGVRSGAIPTDFAIIFGYLLVALDYPAAMVSVVILVLAALVPKGFPAARILRWLGEHPWSVALFTTVALCFAAVFVYHAHPVSMDEYCPLFQSEVFASGHLAGRFPPEFIDWFIPERLQNEFLYVSRRTGAVASYYWPSHAMLLTPFTMLGIPWALNPLLTGLSVLVVHRLALRMFGNIESAGLATLLTVASPVIFANGISFYAMTAHMLFNGIFVLLLLTPTRPNLVAAGFVGSVALTLHSPVPHMLFAVPWLLWTIWRDRAFGRIVWLAAGYLPLCLVLGIGWFWFVNTLSHDGAIESAATGHTVSSFFVWPNSNILWARTAGFAKVWLWAVPVLVAMAAMGSYRWRNDPLVRLFAASAVLTFVGFLFIWPDQGHGWGFRYFHSAWLALPLLAAASLTPRPHTPDANSSNDTDLKIYVVACALLSFGALVYRASQIQTFIAHQLRWLPQEERPVPSTIFIDSSQNFYSADLVRNDPFLRDKSLKLVSHGAVANEKFMAQFQPDYRLVSRDDRGEVWELSTANPIQ